MSKCLSDTLFELVNRGFNISFRCTDLEKSHLNVYIGKKSFAKSQQFYMREIYAGAMESMIIKFLNDAAKEIDKEINR